MVFFCGNPSPLHFLQVKTDCHLLYTHAPKISKKRFKPSFRTPLMNSKAILFALLLFSAAFSFTIESYYTDAEVQPNGDLRVKETITFNLEEVYNEGYRSIRPADYGSLSNLVVHSVTVNGQPVNHYSQEYDGKAEIVWTETFAGENRVELDYALKNRVEIWDDYAKVCFEHYGANWAVPAKTFRSTTAMPEASRGKTMHFEVYSSKKGEAYIEDLSVVIEMDNVPSGNYIGGCYLFAKDAVNTTNAVDGSAFAILREEREIYGSESIVSPADAFPCAPCICPVFLVLLTVAGYMYTRLPQFQKLPESILPPSKEPPAAVSAILRNFYDDKEILASTLLGLISKGAIDIMELEKKGYTGQEIKRERTILFLKKTIKKLKPYEKTLIDIIFDEGRKKEVDLDALAEDFKQIKSKGAASKTIIPRKMDLFKKQVKEEVKKKGLGDYIYKGRNKQQTFFGVLVFFIFMGGCFFLAMLPEAIDFIFYLLEMQDYLYAGTILISGIGSILAVSAAAYFFFQPEIPKGKETEFAQWDGFSRAVKASSLNEEPPASALIWGEILAYATALGLAGKVKKHLSELDDLVAKKVEKLDSVRTSSYIFYSSAWGVRNLSKYGNRSGNVRSSGFSGGSSGGWSSGGGGFSGGGFSGGGGFR
ncbi:DUF2207 domain-containing protein [Candidatus Micrarchaeota archaeon]|nr:DUF2207 domain-containing protein [Candidatus Micrarchaeota archaeon]MBD3417426.1 DUF2207 domain-containing protein [Candidatus Micrarchaeota archaeon]